MPRRRTYLGGVLTGLTALVAGCSGAGDSEEPTTTGGATPTETETPTATETPSSAEDVFGDPPGEGSETPTGTGDEGPPEIDLPSDDDGATPTETDGGGPPLPPGGSLDGDESTATATPDSG